MEGTSKRETEVCPECGARFPLAEDQLESVLAGYRERIKELEVVNESHRRLNEWARNQQVRKIRKRKADSERGFG